MSKKRVYELAKELGLENKELIARLEKIGIAVKSHSSTLEDSDLERIQSELLSPEPREVVEQTNQVHGDQAKGGPSARPRRRNPKRLPSRTRGRAVGSCGAARGAGPEGGTRRARSQRSSRANLDLPGQARRRSGAQTRDAWRKPFPEPDEKNRRLRRRKVKPSNRKRRLRNRKRSREKPVPEAVPKAPAAEKKPLPVRPPEHREGKPPQGESERRPQIPPEAARPAPPLPRKEFPARPDLKIVKDVRTASPGWIRPAGRRRRNRRRKGQNPPSRS